MGLFTQQPEHNEDWAGLPSEPLRHESDSERLTDAAPVDAAGFGISASGPVESIVIPVTPVIEIAESQESGEGD